MEQSTIAFLAVLVVTDLIIRDMGKSIRPDKLQGSLYIHMSRIYLPCDKL